MLLWLLQLSLASAEGFAQAGDALQSPLAKLILWAVLAALAYHTCAGVRHLFMDMGIGESMEGGVRSAKIVFVASALLIVLAGIWIW
jgi:succinate dehydrogenase / fumarate reductase cytochrome b subunit